MLSTFQELLEFMDSSYLSYSNEGMSKHQSIAHVVDDFWDYSESDCATQNVVVMTKGFLIKFKYGIEVTLLNKQIFMEMYKNVNYKDCANDIQQEELLELKDMISYVKSRFEETKVSVGYEENSKSYNRAITENFTDSGSF